MEDVLEIALKDIILIMVNATARPAIQDHIFLEMSAFNVLNIQISNNVIIPALKEQFLKEKIVLRFVQMSTKHILMESVSVSRDTIE